MLAPGGPPAELARRLGRTIPLVYGSAGVTAVAAQWWKTQVNLNAKAPAFAASLPELTHDELAGWGQGGDVTRQTMSLVLLRHAGEGPRTGGLFAAVRAATDEVMADIFEVQGEGDDELSRFFDLTLHGHARVAAPGCRRRRGPRTGARRRRGTGPRLALGSSPAERRTFADGVRPLAGPLDQLSRSTIMAMPWPPPTHMDSRPNVLPVSSSALSSVVMMRAPVWPKG